MNNLDIHALSYELLEKLENAYYDREGQHRGREKFLFKIEDVHYVEKFLTDYAQAVLKDAGEY